MYRTAMVCAMAFIFMGVWGCSSEGSQKDSRKDEGSSPVSGGLGGLLSCEEGLLACGGTCVEESAKHCGVDCKLCPAPSEGVAVCEEGACTTKENCEPGFHNCGGYCVSDNAVETCGTRCAPCTATGPGVVNCEEGECITRNPNNLCEPGFHDCNNQCVWSLSVETCGTRCRPCPKPAHGDARCDGVDCKVACDSEYHACGSQCLPDISPGSCGNRCEPCPAPDNAYATCEEKDEGKGCGFECKEEFHLCDNQCVSDTSPASCGPTSCEPCPEPPANASATCVGGRCGFECNSGFHLCGSQCVSNASINSCGPTACAPCDNALPDYASARACVNEICSFECMDGYHRCGNQCVSNASVNSCGLTSCTPCPVPNNAYATCEGGACGFQCNSGFHLCGNQCISDASVNACGTHCIACNNVPPANASVACINGSCDFSCNAGYVRLGNACMPGAISVRAGGGLSCALMSNGKVFCWGRNDHGQLGTNAGGYSVRPVEITGASGATAIAVGLIHACALLTDGSVKCWGNNGYGQLGDDSPVSWSHVPVPVSNLSNVKTIAAGRYHTCAILNDGHIMCWGRNINGELGNGLTGSRSMPVQVTGISDAKAIAAGDNHSCAIDGTEVKCWGRNTEGQFGNHSDINSRTPVSTYFQLNASGIAAGNFHTCALNTNTNGIVFCAGNNTSGQLGNGSTRSHWIPVDVHGLTNVQIIATGGWLNLPSHTCATTANAETRCWGSNADGQVDPSNSSSSILTPALVLSGEVVDLGLGSYHSCAVLSDGNIRCWGSNNYEPLGNGSYCGALGNGSTASGGPFTVVW